MVIDFSFAWGEWNGELSTSNGKLELRLVSDGVAWTGVEKRLGSPLVALNSGSGDACDDDAWEVS